MESIKEDNILTEKQKYQREYYAKHKADICNKKRAQYKAKQTAKNPHISKPKSINPINLLTSIPNSDSRTRSRKQDKKEHGQLKRRQQVRRELEDREMAIKLGIDFHDLY